MTTALALVPDEIIPRLQGALARSGLTMVRHPVDAPAAHVFAACCAQAVHVVLLTPREGGGEAEVSRLLRAVGFPVLLLSSATNPVQVNASRKAIGASLALGAAFTDADLLAAMKTLVPGVAPAERAPVKLPMSTPAAENDPAWTLARYCVRRSTGFLKLAAANGTAEVTIHLLDGSPVVAVTNVRGARLGEILVRSGKATAEQVERAMRVVERKKDVRLGTVLVDQGVVARDAMLREVAAQYASRVLTTFAWPVIVPQVRFEPIPTDDARIAQTREALFLDGLRTKYDAMRLKALVPLDAVYEFTKDAAVRLSAFGFTVPEANVIASIDGTRNVSEVVVRTGHPLEALRALYGAYCLDLIRPRGQA